MLMDLPDINPLVKKVDLKCQPIKQKKWSFVLECQKAIAKEVDKLLDADFIWETIYPEWISNIVMVKKANGKW